METLESILQKALEQKSRFCFLLNNCWGRQGRNYRGGGQRTEWTRTPTTSALHH